MPKRDNDHDDVLIFPYWSSLREQQKEMMTGGVHTFVAHTATNASGVAGFQTLTNIHLKST